MESQKNTQYNILIAEDDPDIVNLLSLYLENEGYPVFRAANGLEAIQIMESTSISFGIFDIMMPKMDGYALLKKVRQHYNMPILILSAKDQDSDKILGLDLGADDYMTKPFNPLEVVARVRAGLRRFYRLGGEVAEERKRTLSVGALTLYPEEMRLEKDHSVVELTPTEFKILRLLMQSPGRIFTKLQIYEQVNGVFFEGDENTLMVHISNIREKIEDNPRKPVYLKTIRGLGYKMATSEELAG